ncbi:MAG: prepilin-type N-terminal cleavage/methylation domain-containing protein [candidate division Zixibacteria bacterium]|nr:prepilin-type N-terminal cleavage/methylation domain-containing protein [candidate division Zixibacteria bacterium]
MSSQKGFTLVELLVTLLLISILGTLVVSVMSFVSRTANNELTKVRTSGEIALLSNIIQNDFERGRTILSEEFEESHYGHPVKDFRLVLGIVDTVTYEIYEGAIFRNSHRINDRTISVDSIIFRKPDDSTEGLHIQHYDIFYTKKGESDVSHQYAILAK